jgi:acyl dehydratase
VATLAHSLDFDDLEVGQEWETLGRTVTETDVVWFAGLSGDFNPIHVDHEFARSTPFGRPIAHGVLVLSLSSGLILHAPPVRTLAFLEMRDWRFLHPVFLGDTVHVRSQVLHKEPRSRGRRGRVTWERRILNQVGKVVQQGITVTLVEGKAARAQHTCAEDQAGLYQT